MSRASLQWWVRAGSRAYGPYASERLPAFVREGRLTPESSVANDPSGPWWPAGRNPSLDELFSAAGAEPPPAKPSARQEPAPRGRVSSDPASWPRAAPPAGSVHDATPAPRPTPPQDRAPQRQPATAGEQAFVVFAELLEGREARLAAVLDRMGAVARARPGVWLLRTGADVAAVRNVLSQALGEGESLMVVRAEAGDAAWFNLGGEADRALRQLWLQPTGRSSRA